MSIVDFDMEELIRRRLANAGPGAIRTTSTAAAPGGAAAGSDVGVQDPYGTPFYAPQGRTPLTKDPQLPQHPLGAYTDAEFEAANALLRSRTGRKWSDVLQQIGFVEPESGRFIRGSVELQAARDRAVAERNMQIAREQAINEQQNLGTIFSGKRAVAEARATEPYLRAMGELDTQTPLLLQRGYEQAAGMIDEFMSERNQLLTQAAARRAQQIRETTPAGGEPVSDSSLPPVVGNKSNQGEVSQIPPGYFDPVYSPTPRAPAPRPAPVAPVFQTPFFPAPAPAPKPAAPSLTKKQQEVRRKSGRGHL